MTRLSPLPWPTTLGLLAESTRLTQWPELLNDLR
jgi:hypothetical protein